MLVLVGGLPGTGKSTLRALWPSMPASTQSGPIPRQGVGRQPTPRPRLRRRNLRAEATRDRGRAYDHVELLQRQVCWAHLKRNWEKMQERGGKAKIIAGGCLSVQKRVFEGITDCERASGALQSLLGGARLARFAESCLHQVFAKGGARLPSRTTTQLEQAMTTNPFLLSKLWRA